MKTILVTGSSSGIGRATVIRFQSAGWNVAATMRNPENERELQKLSHVAVFQLDVTDQKSINSTVAGTLDKFGDLTFYSITPGMDWLAPSKQ